jgi:hypothetical protein
VEGRNGRADLAEMQEERAVNSVQSGEEMSCRRAERVRKNKNKNSYSTENDVTAVLRIAPTQQFPV